EALIDRAYSKDNLVLSGEVTYRNRSVAPKLFDSDDQQYSINVDFLEMVGPDAYIEAHLQNHYKRLFFEKMEDWRDESEWRCIVFSQTSESLYLDFEDSM